jgi:L-arabinonolactonase
MPLRGHEWISGMPDVKISKVETQRCIIGEGPVWDVAEQALYFIDILGKKVLRFDPVSGETRDWAVPDVIGSMALRAGGGAVVALATGVHTLDFDSGACAMLATSSDLNEMVQLADGKVDRRGRFIVGSSDRAMEQARGKLYVLEGDATLREIDSGIIIANGPCWSPDNSILYHSDSIRNTVFAYDYDIETGTAANRREFASTAELGGIPDGATIDADGCMWMAICEGQKVVQFRPDGALERVIDMPVKCPASVMFGGPALDQLYVTSLSPAFLGREEAPLDGCTFVIEGLGVTGLPEPRYAG